MRKLTGRMRYRSYKPLFRKAIIVLQVEVECGGVTEYCDGTVALQSPKAIRFLDARVEDLVTLKVDVIDNL